jgi:hypothetical protein
MPDGWDASERDTGQDRSGFSIFGRNSAGRQGRAAAQCRAASLIGIKLTAGDHAYGWIM